MNLIFAPKVKKTLDNTIKLVNNINKVLTGNTILLA